MSATSDPPDSPDAPLPAGDFATWLAELVDALRDGGDTDVPCDGCTACCTSSQFVHVEPDERDTLAHIPPALLFPAPGLPRGHVVMGYDAHGKCPMLVDGTCSIYEHRPRTCRTYDCRVFAATGIDPVEDGDDKRAISARVRRWTFTYPTTRDRAARTTVRAAARSVTERGEERAPGDAPTSATSDAVLAIRSYARLDARRTEREPSTGTG